MMSKLKIYTTLGLFLCFTALAPSCKSSKSYPCPKNDSKRAANLSDREDNGASPNNPKGKASKKNNGLIKKKEPKRIHKR